MRAGRTSLLLIVFVSGMTTMAVEMSASRLLAPYFGDSLLIWSVLIGLILIYLTIGYYLGGHLADRSPQESTLYQITAWAAFIIGLVPFMARPVLRLSAWGFVGYNVALLLGSLLGVVLLFAIPVTLLGCVSPFAIRLAVRNLRSTGNVAGGIYALSTLGSIIGTFTPVLVLIPNIGTRWTFFLFSLILLGLSLIGLARALGRRALPYTLMPVIVLSLALLWPGGAIKATEGLVYEVESAYNYIQVVQEDDWLCLYLNEGQGIHSAYSPDRVLTDSTWDYFLVIPFFNDPPYTADRVDNLCLVGLAAGTVAKQYTAIYGPMPIDGVEIDPQIVAVGRRFFAMNEPNLNAVVGDGRYFLAHSHKRYDVVAIDAYRPPYIPFHLTTQEFFTQVRDHLTEEGVVAINVARTAWDYSLIDLLSSTMRAVFPSVYLIDPFDYGSDLSNSLVVATRRPTKAENFRANMEWMTDPFLLTVARRMVNHISEVQGSGVVYTDDRAPIEQATHRLLLKYMLGAHP